MRLQITNESTRTFDVFRFGFESEGALWSRTNTQGSPLATGSLYWLRRTQACMFHWYGPTGEVRNEVSSECILRGLRRC